MNPSVSVECLEDAGIISPELARLTQQILSRLPAGTDPALALLLAQGILNGQQAISSSDAPLSTEVVSSGDREVPMSLSDIQGTKAVITVFENNIVFRLDGEEPTDGLGHFAAQGSNFTITRLEEFIFTTASDSPATIFVSYYA